LERGELLRDVHGRLSGDALHLLDLPLQLEQRALEVQGVGRHHIVRTRCTQSGPSRSRNAPSSSSSTATRSERLRRRAALTPGASPGTLPPPLLCASSHSTSTGAGPGCAAHSAATARLASGGGGVSGDQRNATAIAPAVFSSSSGCAASTMNGACSSSRSRAL